MSNKLLETRFRVLGGKWQFRHYPEGSEQSSLEWTDWNPDWKEKPGELMTFLFGEDAAYRLLDRAWDLRLRPTSYVAGDGIPNVPWQDMVHPKTRFHILEAGWTLTESFGQPVRGETSGEISVIGAPALAGVLRQRLGPIVRETAPGDVAPRSIVVAGRALSAEEAERVQEAAYQGTCPLIVWEDYQPRGAKVPCVVVKRPLTEYFESWLSRFLRELLAGTEPARAFAEAGVGSVADRGALCLRGAFETWNVDDTSQQPHLPQHWYISLDRSKQEGHLNVILEGLLADTTKRRIVVVLVPGPEGAGLDLFRERPLRTTATYKLVEWDLAWADNPGSTIQLLMRKVGAPHENALSHKLQEKAAVNTNGRTLFLVRHGTISVHASDKGMHIELNQLGAYLKRLEGLAPRLGAMNLRMLFHISVLSASVEQLKHFKKKQDYYLCDVLKELDPGVPSDELEQWLDAREVPFEKEDLERWSSCTYDELVSAIVARNPLLVTE